MTVAFNAFGKSLSCEVDDLVDAAVQQIRVVPKKIFHFGKRVYMDQNISARTIPKIAWDKFIMDGPTLWELQPTRRGLYGTSSLDTNQYTNEALIEIVIKEECRNPSRVGSLMDLHRDKRFIDWYENTATPVNFQEFKVVCKLYNENYYGYDDPRCDGIVGRFLEDYQIGVLIDYAIEKSFYIRDRSCIQTINGTPDEVLNILSGNKQLWEQTCNTWSKFTKNNISQIIFPALESAKQISVATIAALKEHANMHGFTKIESAISALVRCKREQEANYFKKYFSPFSEVLDYDQLCR